MNLDFNLPGAVASILQLDLVLINVTAMSMTDVATYVLIAAAYRHAIMA